MRQEVNLLSKLPRGKRNVNARAEAKTDEIIAISRQYGELYFDGPRKYGYGGYRYDGRWIPVAEDMVKHFDLKPGDRVLDVGCATGYGAAVLAHIAGQVVALEQDADLAQAARTALSGQQNVSVVSGALTGGWPQGSPYDAVVLEGATEIPPETFLSQLKQGGRLVCVLGGGPAAKAMLYCRSGDELGGRPIFDATAAVLPGFAETPVFAF